MQDKERFEWLKNWLKNYLYSRDSLEKKILKISDTESGLEVFYAGGKKCTFLIEPEPSQIQRLQDSDITALFFNTEANLKAVIQAWQSLKDIPRLKLIFINPNAEDIKWSVAPHLHTLISDEKSLAKGLRSMFDTVGKISEEEINNLVKNN
ncbi:MAG: hypothetical protein QXW00_03975 [Candidatus Woesearchaeota archaeon]